MKPLVVIRPEPGCTATSAAAQAAGLDVHGFPLFAVRALPWDAPDPQTIDALLVGSANALRHAGAALTAFAGKPAYAVGETTAQACRDAGFEVVATGEGGLQALLERLDPAHRRLLRLAGAVRIDLTPPPGIEIIERVVYASEPVAMPDALAGLLRQPCVVMLHSSEAARTLRTQCGARSIALSTIALAAIGPRVAEAAGTGWHAVRAAQSPDDEALLALAREMCEETAITQGDSQGARFGLMQDQTQFPAATPVARPRRSIAGMLLLALFAFALGAAAVAFVAMRGYLDPLLPGQRDAATQGTGQPAPTPANGQLAAVGTVEARLAMLEDRFSRIDAQASAAAGNAARAESLLVALAVRRTIDRGEPLRYLASQLSMRFANAQPAAVATVVQFARNPVTLDELSARLLALAPDLAGTSANESVWAAARRNVTGLFTVHRERSSVMTPDARIERANLMLRSGRIQEAMAEVDRLPGAGNADTWMADARRYAEAQQALDLLETTAMLEPDRLRDGAGNAVTQPSPLVHQAPAAAAAAKPATP